MFHLSPDVLLSKTFSVVYPEGASIKTNTMYSFGDLNIPRIVSFFLFFPSKYQILVEPLYISYFSSLLIAAATVKFPLFTSEKKTALF